MCVNLLNHFYTSSDLIGAIVTNGKVEETCKKAGSVGVGWGAGYAAGVAIGVLLALTAVGGAVAGEYGMKIAGEMLYEFNRGEEMDIIVERLRTAIRHGGELLVRADHSG